MSSLSIGLSGMQASQRLIALTGLNLTNATTPGYHRQVAELVPRVAGTSSGLGVDITRIYRLIDQLLEQNSVRNNTATAGASTTLDGLKQIEAMLAPGDGSIHDSLENFFNEAERLTAEPKNLTLRRIVLAAAVTLTDRLNSTVADLDQMRFGLIAQAEDDVDRINVLTDQIARLNRQIHDMSAGGGEPNELMDQRDQAIADLSQIIDVRTIPQEFNQVNVFAVGTPLVLNATAIKVNSSIDINDHIIVRSQDSQQSIDVSGGKLGGALALYNTILPGVRDRFDTFAGTLVTTLDKIQATGLGMDGPLTSLVSLRTVPNVNFPLVNTNLHYPPQAGTLNVTVTNLATGQRTLSQIAIDPATQSLSDIATAISAIPNLQAVVDAQAGTLNIIAAQGFGFDFTGNYSTIPDTLAISGTTTPTFQGQYAGAANDTLQYTFVGSGTIGLSPNIALEVRNNAGSLLASLNVGQGYEAGTPLPAVLGISVALTTGTVNNGDTFSLNVVSDPDTAHLLPALGLNSFFIGDNANGLRVRPDLLDHPERFSLSQSGLPGDGDNLERIVALREQPVLNGQVQSFREYLEGLMGDVGMQVQDTQIRKSGFEALGQHLDQERQTVSGVDPNEELMRLVQHQRSFQMAAQLISTVNQTFDDLLQMI